MKGKEYVKSIAKDSMLWRVKWSWFHEIRYCITLEKNLKFITYEKTEYAAWEKAAELLRTGLEKYESTQPN